MRKRVHRGDSDYEASRQSMVWNDMTPPRYPDAIYTPESPDEVGQLVRGVIPSGQRISVRSGGHNWLGVSLRQDGALINLSELRGVEVTADGHYASAGPGATHQMLADAIAPRGLAFPIGHCPSVGLGGYLLAGGMGWNLNLWGPGCWNVAAADVVMADGRQERIDGTSHPDLFWALRGGASGFPGIVTSFLLELHELPTMMSRTVSFPLTLLPELLQHVSGYLAANPPGIEIAVIARRPQDAPGEDPRVTLSQTAFAATPGEAEARLDHAIADSPARDRALADSGNRTAVFNELEGEGGWIRGPRYFADTSWVSGHMPEIGRQVANAIRQAPSPASRIIVSFGLMPAPEPDVAFTRFGELTVNIYATWDDPADDERNITWVRSAAASLEEFTQGHYIGESDLPVSATRLLESYPAHKLARLREITATYDPEKRLHSFLSDGW